MILASIMKIKPNLFIVFNHNYVLELFLLLYKLPTMGKMLLPKILVPSNILFVMMLIICFYLGAPQHVFADSAIQCHCFKNRSCDESDRFAADAYILATSFNSLLARLAALPKKQIVMIKMNEGMAQDDLLISLKIAKTTGQELQKVLDLRRQNDNWAEIIAGLPLQETVNKDEILGAIRAGASTEVAATRVADESIALFFGTPEEEIRKLRMSGLNEKEITLTLLLNHVNEIQPEALVEQYKDKGKSWSEIAYSLGVEPKAAGKLILAYPAKKIPENN